MMNNEHAKESIVWAVVVWTFAVTLGRAIRMPNDFSEAYWLLDYRFGFIKRGFVGAICRFVADIVGIQLSPRPIAILSGITLLCMSAAMLYLLFRAFRRQDSRDSILVVGVVFASSPFVVMMAYLLGYFDAILYCLAIGSVGLVLSDRPFFAAIMSALAILIHESYLLVGFPLVILASVALLTAHNNCARWRPHIFALCIPIFAFFAVLLLQTLTTDATSLRSQLAEHLDSFGFVPTRSEGVAVWQTTPFMEFLRQQNGEFDERLLNPVILASVTPTLLAILVFIHTSYRIRAFSPFSIILLGLVCAPLAMHAVAWDTARISTYSIGGGFIASWILAETRAAQRASHLFLLIALPALILNAFGRIPLMDDEVERFSDPVRLLLYLPAIALLATSVVRNLRGNWFKEFTQEGIPNKAIDSDEE